MIKVWIQYPQKSMDILKKLMIKKNWGVFSQLIAVIEV